MIHNQVYKDKKEAGTAILETCKSLDPSTKTEIGSYRGLALLLSWDAFSKEFVLHLQGASAYSVHLSDDIYGNLPYEANYSEKTERLNQLKLALNLDKKDPVLDREPDAGEQMEEKQDRDYSR